MLVPNIFTLFDNLVISAVWLQSKADCAVLGQHGMVEPHKKSGDDFIRRTIDRDAAVP